MRTIICKTIPIFRITYAMIFFSLKSIGSKQFFLEKMKRKVLVPHIVLPWLIIIQFKINFFFLFTVIYDDDVWIMFILIFTVGTQWLHHSWSLHIYFTRK